jgi:hypothetical protein
MDGKLGTFLLGVIAAVVLVMLWKRDDRQPSQWQWSDIPTPQPQPSAGCGSCGTSYAASPGAQSALESIGMSGMIASPGVPLGAATGGGAATSFYTGAGVTPDTTFTFTKTSNVAGSPTVPAATTPVRATEAVAPYSTGFHQHYNILGIPVKGYIQ